MYLVFRYLRYVNTQIIPWTAKEDNPPSEQRSTPSSAVPIALERYRKEPLNNKIRDILPFCRIK